MTEHGKGRASDGGRADAGTPPDGERAENNPSVVIRDKRKIRHGDDGKDAASRSGDAVEATGGAQPEAAEQENGSAADAGTPAPEGSGEGGAHRDDAVRDERPETTDRTEERTEPAGPFGAELEALRGHVDELTRDLQRITAEYANYRKRVERDRALVLEQATSGVLTALLPVLDDLDRARDHGDLVGPFGSVAEQLIATLTKFGLTPFGEKGDPFDPTRHEAVAHMTSADVTEPTCVDVLRRGYLLGERLLRPALVAVADPE